jgi:hypothetical protein
VRRGPKAAAADERGDGSDVERYEQLRRRVLDGEVQGWQLGLAVLQRRGVAAWLRAWQVTTPAPVARPTAPQPMAAAEVVGVLASMALACLRTR